ncbi:threonylcarbamoyl-AMP synthase [Heliobacillus mobilis]|uniref:Threonylcarbamoyl-AMP synthase n=2 Tax=Heliobacterium mobile TaxID=28064 RepID=A0A6I3SLD7_HELMO|nr:L-threonylcarbamoyladenylate synthase [Heliobacterium mobile]MTV49565.1 threonylcarbamoyl-AMP synthase [Heliobacterium mobile]
MTETKIWRVDPHNFHLGEIQEAALLLRAGKLVAFPTETVYGLGANALDVQAVQGIFRAKGRPSDNPLIVHITGLDELAPLVSDFPPMAQKMAELFWPGPLTIILPASKQVPAEVTAGLSTVAIRMPSHPVARELIRSAKVPVAAPSANRSGKPSPTTADHVRQDLWGRVDGLVDGGECTVGLESTVVDVTGDHPVILRPGGITREMLSMHFEGVEVDGEPGVTKAIAERPSEVTAEHSFPTEEHVPVENRLSVENRLPAEKRLGEANGEAASPANPAPRSPGMKYTHYAPKAPVYLLTGPWKEQVKAITVLLEKETDPLGLLISEETYEHIKELLPQECGSKYLIRLAGSREDLRSVAYRLFGSLRSFDETSVTAIIAESYPREGIGMALMNRLTKAAGGRIWRE